MGLVPLIIDIDDDIIKPLFAKEGDHRSRGILLQILNKGKEIDTTGIIVEFFAKPRDGKAYVVEATPVDATKGKYEIVYPSSILQPGVVQCEIRLVKMTDDEIEEIITTKTFNLKVYKTIADEDIFEGIDIEPIVEILVQAAINEEERIAAENERIQAENARKSSENERKSNEQIRQQKEDERQQNEITRQTNEQTRQQNEQQRIDLYNALKDLDVSQHELRLQKLEHDTSVEEIVVEEAYGPVIPLPENVVNGQINEIKIFGNTETDEEGNTKSTLSARVKSVGKNLVRNGNGEEGIDGWLSGLNSFTPDFKEGTLSFDGTWFIITDQPSKGNGFYRKIRVKKNTNYTISFITQGYTISFITQGRGDIYVYGEQTRTIIITASAASSPKTFNSGENDYISVAMYSSSATTMCEFRQIQLEEGTQATEYEPYKETIAYLPNVVLRSLPNGTKDEINVANRRLIKRIEVKSNITSGTIINFTDMAEGGTYFAWNENGETETGTKGDTLGIDAITLIYQLAEPIEIPIEVSGNLQSYENGTVYIDTIIPKVSFYDSANGIQVTVPIKVIDTLYKVDKETGVLTPLDISQAVIAEDGLSFTHPELADGDLVDWDYVPNLESTNPCISMKLPTNLKASVTSALQGVQELSSETKNLNTRVIANRRDIETLNESLLSNVMHLSTAIDSVGLSLNEHEGKSVFDFGGVHGLEIGSGIFTPVLYGTEREGSHVYERQIGRYWKIGKLVFIQISLQINAGNLDSNMAGVLRIKGLPFTSAIGTNFTIGLTKARLSNLNYGDDFREILFTILSNANYITLYFLKNDGSFATVTQSALGSGNTIIEITGVYLSQ